MDNALCTECSDFSELVSFAERNGADEAVVLQTHALRRHDEIQSNASVASRLERHAQARLYVRVQNAVFHAALTPSGRTLLAPASLERLALDAIQAARLADVWGPVRPCHKLPEPQTSAQPASIPVCPPKDARSNRKSGQTACFDPAFLQDLKSDTAPILPRLVTACSAQASSVTLHAHQTTELVTLQRQTRHAISRSQHVQTTLEQTLSHGTQTLTLPPYLFDGPLLTPDAPEHAPLLQAGELAADFARACVTQSTAASAPQTVQRVILMPWAAAVLAHEARHLSPPPAHVPFTLDTQRALYTPPPAPFTPFPQTPPCPAFALIPHTELPEHSALLPHTVERTFLVDAPDAWVRKNDALLDIRFRIAQSHAFGTVEQHFQSLTLRFDLKHFWEDCAFMTAPVRRITLPCTLGPSPLEVPCILAMSLGKSEL